MKAIVIIYAISWLILFVVYLISLYENRKSKKMSKTLKAFLNSQKSRRDKILDKSLYVILIIFAPLVVFVVPYVVVKHVKSKKEARIREEEKRKTEQEHERHKTECSENYSKWANRKNNSCGKDHIRLAQSLMDLVRQQKYNEFLNLLDKASLPSTMALAVKECIRQGTGDRSRLCIKRADDAFTFNIYGYLEFENSAMGAWQAYLVDRLWHSLPLWWHDNYNKRDYIYSKEDINKITHFVERNFDASVLANYDLAPEIYGENGRYYISCCYWTDFEGLKREYVEISLLDGKLDKPFLFDQKVIHRYDCGIMF